LMLTAKGIPFIYYGEEIGMHNITAQQPDEIMDIQGKTHYQLALKGGKAPAEALIEANAFNRDKSRSPMQWSGNPFAGFSTAKSWIKIGQDYKEVNVQELAKKENSILNLYKQLIALRNKEKVLQYGSYNKLEYVQDQVLFTRYFGTDKISVIINFGTAKKAVLPAEAKILMGTADLKTNGFIIYRN
ncbi:MAG: DUF3459 domain-containing protein, partial [Ferruginibacter sp.]